MTINVMNLRQTILKEHSKANCTEIVNWVGNSQKRFDELFNLFLNDEYRVVQRAAWPLSYIAIACPKLIAKHFAKLIRNLHKPGLHNAVKRNTVRLLQEVAIPERFHEMKTIIEDRWDFETAAFKSCAMKILKRIY